MPKPTVEKCFHHWMCLYKVVWCGGLAGVWWAGWDKKVIAWSKSRTIALLLYIVLIAIFSNMYRDMPWEWFLSEHGKEFLPFLLFSSFFFAIAIDIVVACYLFVPTLDYVFFSSIHQKERRNEKKKEWEVRKLFLRCFFDLTNGRKKWRGWIRRRRIRRELFLPRISQGTRDELFELKESIRIVSADKNNFTSFNFHDDSAEVHNIFFRNKSTDH